MVVMVSVAQAGQAVVVALVVVVVPGQVLVEVVVGGPIVVVVVGQASWPHGHGVERWGPVQGQVHWGTAGYYQYYYYQSC